MCIAPIGLRNGRELTPPVLNRRENGTGVSKMRAKCGGVVYKAEVAEI